MARVESNKDEVSAFIRGLANLIDFTEPGENKSLGEDCLDIIATGIQTRAREDQAGASGPWADNAEDYANQGANKIGPRGGRSKLTPTDKFGKPVGDLTGEMLSDVELRGTRHVVPSEARVLYGTSEDSRNKASWFHRGSEGPGDGPASGAKNQPPRPDMFALDDKIIEDVNAEIGRHVDRKIERLRGA